MTNREKLRRIVDGTDTRTGRAFDWVVIALILYSIVTLTIETLPTLDPALADFLHLSEIVVTLVFTLEFGVRMFIAERRRDYLLSFNGIIDLLAIAPFYIALLLGVAGIDLRAVRAFRLFRIFRLLKIARYNRALARFHRAFLIAREEMTVYLILTLILLFVAATGIYYFENPAQPEAFPSIAHSLWWAVATLTTVGYGDVYPVTLGGRIFTFCVLMIGLGIVAVPAGLIASALSQVRREEELQQITRDGDPPRA